MWFGFGQVHTYLENYEVALDASERSLEMSPDFEYTRIFLVIQLMGLGRESEAREQAAALRRVYPEYRVGSSRYLNLMTDHALRDKFYTYLRQAGLE